jgi:hypothetical protein
MTHVRQVSSGDAWFPGSVAGVWSVTLEQSGSPGRHYHSVDVVVRVSHCVTVEQAVRSAQRACPGFAAVACERVS